ncbi:DUF6766 family protein [Brucella pituitosa]|uniref:DUF6766 family protein n=1 Tax=Brucella pituitosa TaxID=571256 RepID=UPI003CE4AB9A
MRSFFRDNSLTIALMGMFSLTLIGMTILGHVNYNQDLLRHHQTPIGLAAYLISGEFLSALFENWESEFLQMGVYVVLTALLVQRGSAESRDPKEVDKEPSNKPRTSFFQPIRSALYYFRCSPQASSFTCQQASVRRLMKRDGMEILLKISCPILRMPVSGLNPFRTGSLSFSRRQFWSFFRFIFGRKARLNQKPSMPPMMRQVVEPHLVVLQITLIATGYEKTVIRDLSVMWKF